MASKARRRDGAVLDSYETHRLAHRDFERRVRVVGDQAHRVEHRLHVGFKEVRVLAWKAGEAGLRVVTDDLDVRHGQHDEAGVERRRQVERRYPRAPAIAVGHSPPLLPSSDVAIVDVDDLHVVEQAHVAQPHRGRVGPPRLADGDPASPQLVDGACAGTNDELHSRLDDRGAEERDLNASGSLLVEVLEMLDEDVARTVEEGGLVLLRGLDADDVHLEVVVPAGHLLDAVDDRRAVHVAVGELDGALLSCHGGNIPGFSVASRFSVESR